MSEISVLVFFFFFLFKIESTCSEDAMKTVEMTINNLDYHINLVGKEAAGFKRMNSNFERSSTGGKIISNSFACYREIFHVKKSQLIWQASLLSYFKKLPAPFQPSAATTGIIQWPSVLRQDPQPVK